MLQKNSKNPVDGQKDKCINPKSFWKHPRALATKYYCMQKMKFVGHIKRHQSLEKQIYEGIVPGKRGRGRPKRRWSQDITDRLQTTVAEAGCHAQDRNAYRRAVINATSRGAYAT